MRTGILLQARIGSVRLPGKVLMSILGDSIIGWCMRSLSDVACDEYNVVTDYKSVYELRDEVQRYEFNLCVGDSDHVLSRYARFAHHLDLDVVLRATADNPFVSSHFAQSLLAVAIKRDVDYACYTNLPVGVGVECIKTSALMTAFDRATTKYDQEHVCPYIYNNEDMFTIAKIAAPLPTGISEEKVRFSATIDTQEDFQKVTGWINKRSKEAAGTPIHLEELVSLKYAR